MSLWLKSSAPPRLGLNGHLGHSLVARSQDLSHFLLSGGRIRTAWRPRLSYESPRATERSRPAYFLLLVGCHWRGLVQVLDAWLPGWSLVSRSGSANCTWSGHFGPSYLWPAQQQQLHRLLLPQEARNANVSFASRAHSWRIHWALKAVWCR